MTKSPHDMKDAPSKAALLKDQLARAAERITDEQMRQILAGEARLSVTVLVKKSVLDKVTPPKSMAEHCEDFNDVRKRLAAAWSPPCTAACRATSSRARCAKPPAPRAKPPWPEPPPEPLALAAPTNPRNKFTGNMLITGGRRS